MTAVDFTQTYYLRRATQMGISLHLSPHIPTSPPTPSKLNPKSSEFTPRSPVTFVGAGKQRVPKHPPRPRPRRGRERRSGEVWDGYIVQSFVKKGRLREWEWDEEGPEMIKEVAWSEDEMEMVLREKKGSAMNGGGSDGVKNGM